MLNATGYVVAQRRGNVTETWTDRFKDAAETIYFATELPDGFRRRLVCQTERHAVSLATFSGRIVERYLTHFRQDPADLFMICELSRRLDEATPLSVAELGPLLCLTRTASISRLPLDFQARWYHSRLRPHLTSVLVEGEAVDLSLKVLAELLERRSRPDAPPAP